MTKVFCRHCKFFRKPASGDPEQQAMQGSILACAHPELCKKIDRPLQVVVQYVDCCKQNKDNDCEQYISTVPRGMRPQ
jgi:hypothetical protein